MDKFKILYFFMLLYSFPSFWHERAAFPRSLFGRRHSGVVVWASSFGRRRSGGRLLANDVVATIFISLFFFFRFPPLFPPVLFPPSRPFLIEGVLRSKNLFSESGQEHPKYKRKTSFQTPSTILGPLVAILVLTGSAALQAVSKCPQRC